MAKDPHNFLLPEPSLNEWISDWGKKHPIFDGFFNVTFFILVFPVFFAGIHELFKFFTRLAH